MKNMIDRLRRWFHGGEPEGKALPPSSLALIGKAIQTTRDEEFDCEQTSALLDQFAESVARGDDAAPWMDLIRAHLQRCPDCQAEFQALLHILQTEES